jgi:hypothetical protein
MPVLANLKDRVLANSMLDILLAPTTPDASQDLIWVRNAIFLLRLIRTSGQALNQVRARARSSLHTTVLDVHFMMLTMDDVVA